jgi:glutaredoxin
VFKRRKDSEIIVYTTPGCAACAAVKRFLEHRGVPFTEKDVTTNPEHLEEMKQVSGVRIAPVTVVGDQAFYGAFEQQRPQLEQALKQSN